MRRGDERKFKAIFSSTYLVSSGLILSSAASRRPSFVINLPKLMVDDGPLSLGMVVPFLRVCANRARQDPPLVWPPLPRVVFTRNVKPFVFPRVVVPLIVMGRRR